MEKEIMVAKSWLWSSSESYSIDSLCLFTALLCFCVVIGHLLEKNRWMNESITALIVGLCSGVIVLLVTKGKSSHILIFSEDLFFIYLLPPIIFNAGFQMKKKQFFRNFMMIMLFGAVGTLVSFFFVATGASYSLGYLIQGLELRDYLAIGAIFSATDSVCTLQVLKPDETPFLYSLVFGEGVVNDATSVVLFKAIQKVNLHQINLTFALKFVWDFFYLFAASTLLGLVAGLLSAYIIRMLYFGRHSTDREVSLMMLVAYLSYLLADFLGLSCILTIFFCGIVMSHYTWHNVTENSRITTKHSFATLSFISEIFIFLYVGMDALDIQKWKIVSNSPGTSLAASSILLGFILVGRAAFVFPLSFLSNLSKKSSDEKIGINEQVTIWWAGLMRGAVSMALAYKQFTFYGYTQQPANAVMITSTITIVLFSTMIFGMMTKPLLRLLLPGGLAGGNNISSSAGGPKPLLSPLLENGSDSQAQNQTIAHQSSLQLLTMPTHRIHQYWRKFDNAFMRPVFGGRGFASLVQGSPIGQRIHETPKQSHGEIQKDTSPSEQ